MSVTASKREVMLSFLVMDATGLDIRSVCNGCTRVLETMGVVRRIGERPINERQQEFVTAWFRIVEPYTLADCQREIAYRHRDRKVWGSA
jgi:hypothetical protein